MIKFLHAGERFIFTAYDSFSFLKRGNLEVYAVGDSRRKFLGGEVKWQQRGYAPFATLRF